MKPLPVLPADTVRFSQIVRGLHFFGSMDMLLLERVLEGLELREYGRGEKVCTQGEAGDFFFVVRDGRLAVTVRRGGLSLPKRIARLGPGDCFGEMALIDLQPRSASVRALVDCCAIELATAELYRLFERDPEQFALMQMNLGRELSRRLRAADEALFRARIGAEPAEAVTRGLQP